MRTHLVSLHLASLDFDSSTESFGQPTHAINKSLNNPSSVSTKPNTSIDVTSNDDSVNQSTNDQLTNSSSSKSRSNKTKQYQTILRHLAVLLAIPLFCIAVTTLFTNHTILPGEPLGEFLLKIRNFAHSASGTHLIVVLVLTSAALILSRATIVGLYLLSITWGCLFFKNL